MILYKRLVSLLRIIAANSIVTVAVNLILNTCWIVFLYGDAFFALLPARALKQLVMSPIEVMFSIYNGGYAVEGEDCRGDQEQVRDRKMEVKKNCREVGEFPAILF